MATLAAARHTVRAQHVPADVSLLRVLTCGSVDDGKSTLLGRLLFDTDSVLEDQLSALDKESLRWGTQGEGRDYALLLDGLSAEREQGITIDIAYRYFSTGRRSVILADTPGHEQYTRNMATAASNSDLAVILIDARKGVLPQTRRHAFIAATLGVRHAVLSVNKMDLVGFSREVFGRIADEFRATTAALGFASVVPIPVCAREGDNVVSRSDRTPWYDGPSLLEHLETVSVLPPEAAPAGFRLPVQLVLRPDSEFRGYAGTVAGGLMRAGQAVVALPSGQCATIARIVTADGDRPSAGAGQAVTVTLSGEIDVSRGDVLAAAEDPPEVANQVRATLLWLAQDPLVTGRTYAVQLATASANARVTGVRHAVDIQTYERTGATRLGLNEIGVVDIEFDKTLVAAPYAQDRVLGALILVDRLSNQTVAMGVIEPSQEEGAPKQPKVRRLFSARTLAGSLLGGAGIAALTALLSRDLALAAALGFANMLLRPAIDRMMDARS